LTGFRVPGRRCRRFIHAGLGLLVLWACAPQGDSTAPSAPILDRDLQQILDRWRKRDALMAAALAVDLPGRVSWQGASGWFDTRGGRPVLPEDRFRIGSVTKTFVAVVVAQLQQEGKISLQDPIAKYVADAPHSRGVKIEHLLNHTSGIPEAQDAGWARDIIRRPESPWSREKLIAAAAEKSRQFEPGSRFGYSNTNYLLLGDLIQAVTGSSWGPEVRRRILEPLRLSNTFVSDEEVPGGGVVAGYVDLDRDGAADDLFKGPWKGFEDAAGGMISTAPDLIRFARGLFEGRLLGRTALEQMIAGRYFTPSTGYGLGVQLSRPDLETTVVGHTGSNPGFSSALMYLPEHRLAIAALANDSSSNTFDLGELAMQKVLARHPASAQDL
jgi:D-alanyl-D-alanine carboxypeptidase